MPISTLSRARRLRTRTPGRPAAAAALTVVLLAAPGCGGSSGEARSLPALQPADVITSTPPARASSALTAARGTVRRYYAAIDDLRRRMRPAPLARLLTADGPGRAQVRAIRAAAGRGERYTDRIRVTSLLAHLDRADLADVVVSFDVSHAGLVDRAGRRLRPATAMRNVHREVLLHRVGRRWLIAAVLPV
jgi:hypothetical protein